MEDSATNSVCSHCEVPLAGDVRFCPKCGADTNKSCPECGREQRVAIRYCGRCGTDIPAFEKLAAMLDTMRHHSKVGRFSVVIADAEGFSLLQFVTKGAKGNQISKEVSELVRSAQAKQQHEISEIGAIRNFLKQGKVEESLDRIQKLKPLAEQWGESELELEKEIKTAWVSRFQGRFNTLTNEGNYEAALMMLEKLDWLSNRNEWLAAWVETFHKYLKALVYNTKIKKFKQQTAFLKKYFNSNIQPSRTPLAKQFLNLLFPLTKYLKGGKWQSQARSVCAATVVSIPDSAFVNLLREVGCEKIFNELNRAAKELHQKHARRQLALYSIATGLAITSMAGWYWGIHKPHLAVEARRKIAEESASVLAEQKKEAEQVVEVQTKIEAKQAALSTEPEKEAVRYEISLISPLISRGISESNAHRVLNIIRKYGFTVDDALSAWDQAKKDRLIGIDTPLDDLNAWEGIMSTVAAMRGYLQK
jgi:hypothetical protein